MRTNRATTAGAAILAGMLSLALIGCGANASTTETTATQATATEQAAATEDDATTGTSATTTQPTAEPDETAAGAESDTYTSRDLTQKADTSDSTAIAVQSGQDVSITEEGTYVLSGTATDVTVTVNVDSSEKAQLVLDGLSIQNADAPAIYVLSADKVFVTTAQGSENTLAVTGAFVADGETNTDAVIFSKDDLVLNGLGTLTISSTGNGVTSKDDLKVTGGTYAITASSHALEANDGIYVADGTLDITAGEGMEATIVHIDGGTIAIAATDDGINATDNASDGTTPAIEIAGGTVTITMAAGDTDALDSNGTLSISGGTVDITAQFAFDFDMGAELTGGTVYVNGEQVTTIENSMMGGGMMGGPRGRR